MPRIRWLVFLLCLALAPRARGTAFDSGSQGAVVDLGLGTAPVGDFLLGELGGESTGLRVEDDRLWITRWDGLAALKGGTLAATHPFTTLLGGHASGYLELDRRLSNDVWSACFGLRAATDFQLLLPPGTGLSDLRSQLDLDGVGDLNLSGALRLVGGESMVRGGHALLLTAFMQAFGRLGEANLRGASFADFGLSADWQVERSLTLSAEALAGVGGGSFYPPLHLTTDTTRVGFSLLLRKTFANAMWFAASTAWSRESYQSRYDSPAAEFDTTGAPSFALTLLYGFPLGSQP